MSINRIDAELLRKLFIAGTNNLEANKSYINELNVFPVPDGDTGTNMCMTIRTAALSMGEVAGNDLATMLKAMSSGSLRGARGNSGVILSQLIRGFVKEAKESEYIDTGVIARGFERAVETAYKAVMKPKEGTILTVAKAISEKAKEESETENDIAIMLRATLEYGKEVLAKTPDMLPVLKEAGVVDSGGQGLITFFEGALALLEGKEISTLLSTEEGSNENATEDTSRPEITENIYCTELTVDFGSNETHGESELKAYLDLMGDTLVCKSEEGKLDLHVHTDHPGKIIEKALTLGTLTFIKVDNRNFEHEEKLIRNAGRTAAMDEIKRADLMDDNKEKPKEGTAFVTVCTGSGFKSIFESLGATEVIEGGQSMNPSTEDILKAIDKTGAAEVFILPNNKNIIMAAKQAAALSEGVSAYVVPTATIPEGITALINYREGENALDNLTLMEESLKDVSTIEVTYAVRDTSIDGKEIREGNIIAIGDDGLLSVGENLSDTALEAVKALTGELSSLITVYTGAEVSDEDADKLKESIRESIPGVEVAGERGEQAVYYYIISVE